MRGIQSAAVLSSLLSRFALAGPLTKKWSFKDVAIRNGDFPLDVVDKLEEATMPKIEAYMAKKAAADGISTLDIPWSPPGRTPSNMAHRSDLSVPEREDYIKSVLCLMSKPAKAPKSEVPGAVSRFDDFVATHMTMAGMLHDTTHLFGAHRYCIWIYEKALREECGYKGYQPYMSYDRYAADPIPSAMFNGNASSMGGNGLPTDYGGIPQPFPKPHDKIPQAGGGGCVTEGPFKDMVVSLGPKATVVRNIPPNPRDDWLGANPRCLRRDVNKASTMGGRANYTYSLIMHNPDVNAFYNRYLGSPLKNEAYPWGLPNAGHFTVGGDPGGDFYCSPGDPAFYFYHGMLDWVWWICVRIYRPNEALLGYVERNSYWRWL
ncbi:hypothetical protein B0H67DRAFT_557251 [Lasiosphaeris hirsuta]|uniref:Tyrosinase copper-binding domain-containing protein n=1 Tax=Lasiosphaeris hirsuta TaxID=260670 RepID=A0AA39ZVR3_9PEZI|nr:hypothetical protein B0H67DRAFT_557251 [Lasiosphaeris hirsuta]